MADTPSPFVWGAGGSMLSPEQVARQRQIAEALASQGSDYSPVKHWMQGAARLGKSAVGAIKNWQANSAEEEGRAGATSAYEKVAAAMRGGAQPDVSELASTAGNEWLNPGQRSVVSALLQQRMKAQEPQSPYTLGPGQARFDSNGNVIASVPGRGVGEGPRRSLTPQYGVDSEGNPVMLQTGDDGTVAQSKMPDGVRISNKPIMIDAGTHMVILDPVTRQPVGTVPKNVQEAAAAKAQGEAQGEARAQLPGRQGDAARLDQQITDLAQDPYLPNMLGPVMSRLPNVSAESQRVQSRMDQLSGGAFLQARQALKGGGAITDFESRKAEAAMARLNAAQNEKDYKAALEEFRGAIKDGLMKLEQVARDPNSTMANAQNYVPPAPGPGGAKNQDRAVPGVQGARRKYNPETGELE